MKKTVYGIMLMLLLVVVGLANVVFRVQPVMASGTIYIRADGSIDPPTSPIERNGDIYTLTGDITSDMDGIVIERDNILVDGAGFTLEGPGNPVLETYGIDLYERVNVTVKNATIRNFYDAIWLNYTSRATIVENVLTENTEEGVSLRHSSNNTVNGNTVNANGEGGIVIWDVLPSSNSFNNSIIGNSVTNNYIGIAILWGSHNNTISRNNVATNQACGIYLDSSDSNIISENNVTANLDYGISLASSSYNNIYHNNFIDNPQQTLMMSPYHPNVWDNGYPSGGNYWNDYGGIDEKMGPNQNEPGSDKIGDTPYPIVTDNQDNYPLMFPYPCIHAVAVEVIRRNKTIVGQGFTTSLYAEVINQGHFRETFNVTALANTTKVEEREVILSSGARAAVTLTWNTSSFAKGNYTISAYAPPISDEAYTVDNSLSDGWVFVSIPGDVNGDRKVELKDVYAIAKAYGSERKSDGLYWHTLPRSCCPHSPNCDINDDGKIELKDYYTTCKNYGKTW